MTRFLLFVFVILVGYVLVAQLILIPRAISQQYNQRLDPGLMQLRSDFNALSKSTEAGVYNDPFTNVDTARSELLATQKLIATTETHLTIYEDQANRLPTSLLASQSESYKKAEVIKTRTKDVFLQSREVLNDYKQLNDYLVQMNTARTVLNNSVGDLVSLGNLNRLAGQGDVIKRRANQLGTTVTTLKSLAVPTGYGDYHNATIESYSRARTGLITISNGLFSTNDADLYTGARIIEQAILKIETIDNPLFTTASVKSVSLNEASKLSDKVDSLKPFSEQ